MDISSLGITGVAAITVICLLIGQGVKASGVDNKWIPLTCGLCGAVLGIVSGLAATGINQAVKQLGGHG